MFKNVYYDSYNNKIHLWELNNGQTEYKLFDHEIEYYIQDKTKKSSIKDIFGNPVVRQITTNKDKLRSLKESGEILCESDLKEEVKFLHKRYGDQEDKINVDDYNIANIDIEIQTEGTFPKAEEAKFPINLITVEMYRRNEIYTFGLMPYTGENKEVHYIFCESEAILLERFCKFLKLKKVDIITGWNIGPASGGFDIPYIYNRIKNLKLDCKMSPIGKDIKSKYNDEIQIAGIAILDLMALYKKFTYQNQSSYSLDNIAEIEVGDKKLIFEGSISDLWKLDWNKFVDYNIQDVLLVSKIDKKKKLLELAINFSVTTRTPIEKVFSTVAVCEGFILRYLHRKNLVMPDRKEITDFSTIEGGYVEAHEGFYNNLLSYDGTSLYPSIMRQFNISPETKVLNPSSEEGLIKTTIPGLYYRKDIVGVIPEIVTDIFNKRKYNKDLAAEYEISGDMEKFEYYDSQQLIYKILINSIYGAFLEKSFHFYDIDNGSCVTNVGRTSIKYIASCVNDYLNNYFPKIANKYYPNFENKISKSNKVVVIDTDSVVGSSIINTNIGLIKIEDIFNNFVYNLEEREENNFVANVNNLNSLSLNTNNKTLEFKKITYIKKHKVNKRMFKISYLNDFVELTEDHSLIVLRNDNILDICPKDIIKDDKIILNKYDLTYIKDFTIEDLGIQENWVYDIEVEDNHNFFANNILVHNSNYVNMDEVYKSCNTGLSFLDFCLDFEKKILNDLLEKCMKIFANKYNTEPILNFKREKIILKLFVQTKKKYIANIIANEKKIYKEPVTKVTGIEINKSDLCKFSRKNLKKLSELMFEGENPSKELMLEHIRKSYKEFKEQSIVDISSPKGVRDYKKYHVDFPNKEFLTSTPIHNRVSIIYNHIVKEKKLPLIEIDDGTKIKYVYVNSKNPYKTNAIGYVGNWPKEFDKFFKVDYETQFEKQYLNIAQRFFDVLKFGVIVLKSSKLSKLLEDE